MSTAKAPEKNNKVVVGLSGGVDSAVVAALLKQQGYEVIGVTLSLFAYQSDDGKGCCSFTDTIDATQVCDLLGIEHIVFSRRKTFKSEIIDKFVDGHKNGLVYNPCVSCNNLIKMPALIQTANQVGAYYIATGHYTTIQNGVLCRGSDRNKDQSYFLWELPQSIFDRVLFPLGNMTKPEVRKLAETLGIHIAKKPDSTNLCFLEGGKASDFLAARGVGASPGEIQDQTGNKLGHHEGINRYVRGQRVGVPSKDGKPKFVLNVIADTNTVVVGPKEDAYTTKLSLKDVIIHNEEIFNVEDPSIEYSAVCRYQTDSVPIKSIILQPDGTIALELSSGVYGVANGQSVVFYRNDKEVVGGGDVYQKTT